MPIVEKKKKVLDIATRKNKHVAQTQAEILAAQRTKVLSTLRK
jgi:hypothetical protein